MMVVTVAQLHPQPAPELQVSAVLQQPGVPWLAVSHPHQLRYRLLGERQVAGRCHWQRLERHQLPAKQEHAVAPRQAAVRQIPRPAREPQALARATRFAPAWVAGQGARHLAYRVGHRQL